MTTTKNNIPAGYKDSAVGIIPQEWEVKQLGELCCNINSGNNKSRCCCGTYPVFGSTGIIGYTESYLYDIPTILVARVGANAGLINRAHGKYDVSDNTLIIRIDESVYDYNFGHNQLVNYNLNKLVFGSGQPLVTAGQLKHIKLAIPPIKEQKKIAEILGVWDEAIEKQNLLIEKLELRKRALMQRLLTGKTRLPGFTEPWQKVKLGEISTIKKGVQVNKNTLQEYGKYPTINGGIEPSGYSDNYNTEANTITISEGGNSCGYVNFITTKFWSGGHCYTITPLNNIKNLYLYHQLKYFEPRIMIQRVGSGLPNIQFNMLIKFECFLPTLLEQKAIAEVLSTADNEIAIHRKTLDALRKQKCGLMQQLLTGKTRVKI